MGHFWVRLVLNAIALWIIAHIVPGIHVGLVSALIGALVLGAVNALVRPLLVVLTLPVTILSLGLFLLVINAAMFGLAAFLVPGFQVHGFMPALVGSLLYSVAGWTTSHLIHDDRPRVGRARRQAVIEGHAYYDR